jgi:hypothetical protein
MLIKNPLLVMLFLLCSCTTLTTYTAKLKEQGELDISLLRTPDPQTLSKLTRGIISIAHVYQAHNAHTKLCKLLEEKDDREQVEALLAQGACWKIFADKRPSALECAQLHVRYESTKALALYSLTTSSMETTALYNKPLFLSELPTCTHVTCDLHAVLRALRQQQQEIAAQEQTVCQYDEDDVQTYLRRKDSNEQAIASLLKTARDKKWFVF